MNSQNELRYFHLPHGKKHPPLAKRFYDVAVPADQYQRNGHNVGVSTTGLLVVDIDDPKGGSESLDALELAYDSLPRTYTVKTPNGRHFYFKPPHEIANSRGGLGNGIDVRGYHGYVVGAGSWITGGGEYVLEQDAPIADAPQWLVDLCDTPAEKERDTLEDAAELDTPQAIRRATDYLATREPAVQGAGGDDHTFKTAAAVLDFGISKEQALDLMMPWNERCAPPWQPDDLERKIENAWQYRQQPVGAVDARQEFDVWTPPPSGMDARPADTLDDDALEPRRWLYGRALIRGKVTAMVAPPGVGKSTFTLQMAVSVATGKDLLGLGVHESCPVWLYNNEDDLEELHRRLAAVRKEFGITKDELKGRLFLNSGEQHRLTIAKRNGHGTLQALRAGIDATIAGEQMAKHGVGLMIVDPFAETHEGEENDNVQMGYVIGLFRSLAQKANAAMCVVHHTRKPPAGSADGHAGNMDSSRGASSVLAAARVGLTLYSMSEKDAKRFGVLASQRHRYVRLDYSKGNLALLPDAPLWFKRESVELVLRGGSDSVGVLKPAPMTEVSVPAEILDQLVVEACGGEPTPQADVVAYVLASPLSSWSSAKAVRTALQRAEETATAWSIDREAGGEGGPGTVMVVPKRAKIKDVSVDYFDDETVSDAGE